MSSWMNNLRVFGRQAPRNSNHPNQPPSRGNTASPAAYSPSSLTPPSIPPAPASPSLTASLPPNDMPPEPKEKKNEPLFFREDYTALIVKGNFMTLAAKPQQVEEGEWISHQLVEQTRLLASMVKIVQEIDKVQGRPICNEAKCPTMSAGPTTYTWIDTNRNPINLPAVTYIRHIQTWLGGKITDPALFPTDTFTVAPRVLSPEEQLNDPDFWLGKYSGFPQRFEIEVKNMYKQMFRCYAHLYWAHWLDFWHLGCWRELNTCFTHFVNVGRIFGLLSEKDMEPMAPLLNIWVKNGVLPAIQKVEQPPPTSAA
ncbi:Mob1/phocein [Polychaeton citri CBS 116435]|uniref:Mob1/phocein n=1 Tax=Polychaeton citri CBS 116435 TaxID=1314669 RepID=A0A9P4URJ7_9PEZI|nr:Mob1/phocein [Polychaeton citri CBS 116435]